MAKGKKTGGRQKGTPNKENPLKGYLRAHSMSYFEPKPQVDTNGKPREITVIIDGAVVPVATLADEHGNPLVMSDFEADMIGMRAGDRVNAELRLLEFHTPKMKAVELDMEARISPKTIEDRLRELCGENDTEND